MIGYLVNGLRRWEAPLTTSPKAAQNQQRDRYASTLVTQLRAYIIPNSVFVLAQSCSKLFNQAPRVITGTREFIPAFSYIPLDL